jgi:solute carrier family 35 (UDP-xylose/UDP-N-acetylglucosamine transporter), member B4
MTSSSTSSSSSSSSFTRSLFLTFFGCVLNNIFLEFIVSDKVSFGDKRAGPLLTLLQYAFISLLCLPQVLVFGSNASPTPHGKETKKQQGEGDYGNFFPRFKTLVVPFQRYLLLAGLFALMSWLNNLAFAFRVSQPLHVVFRSANLMVTFLFGRIFFERKYTNKQFLLIVALTIGALSNTLAEAILGDTRLKSITESVATNNSNFATWIMGVLILVAVMCLQTLLGEMQSRTTTQFGKAGDESTFFMHLLSVPVLFLLVTASSSPPYISLNGIKERLFMWSQSPPAGVEFMRMANVKGVGSFSSFCASLGANVLRTMGHDNVPVMYVLVALNVVTQYIGITGVYQLVEVCDPLTVNVLLTVRKAISVVASILLFGNTFTIWHFVGALIVFSSSILWGALPKTTIPATQQSIAVVGSSGSSRKKKELIVDVGGNSTMESSSRSRSQSRSPKSRKR